MTDVDIVYIPTMWDDLGILLFDWRFWVLACAVVLGGSLAVRLLRARRSRARFYRRGRA
jgi:hypothetical protein